MKEKLNLLLKKPRSKVRTGLIAGLVLTLLALGATYAYSVHKTQLDNLLTSHGVSGAVIENGDPTSDIEDFTLTPGADVTKKVQFENTGNAPVFVRVAYAQTWLNKDGALLLYDESYATPKWTSEWNSEWSDGGDGWYYYNKVLKAGDITNEVLTSVEFLGTPPLPDEYVNGKYQLTFVLEVVQCSDEEDVNDDALMATFGRSATISDMKVTNGTVTSGDVTW